MPPAARSLAYSVEKSESSHARASGGPMPPNVVKTMGRKARPMSSQPVLCLWFFDLALDMKIASEKDTLESRFKSSVYAPGTVTTTA